MRQDLVRGALQSCKMQEIRLIENQSDESGAFAQRERPLQLHLALHDQKDDVNLNLRARSHSLHSGASPAVPKSP
jgi:hypothetical protein